MDRFYNGNKLLSMLDASGRRPEIFMCAGNRTAGKTYFFKRWFVRRALKYSEKFVVFVRNIDDIKDCASGFWADIGPIEWPNKVMTQKPLLHGKAGALWIDGKHVGYVIALNDPDRIKRNSALFADAERGFFDEFQSEAGKYLPNEYRKFNSVRLSIARGGARGTHARYFPVYMCSNLVTEFNPYYEAMKCVPSTRDKFLRGDGWVLEQTFNAAAAVAIQENFHTLTERELQYATRNEYLLDTKTFVDKIPGVKTCVCLIMTEGRRYGIWQTMQGFYYVSAKLWSDTPFVFALDNASHGPNTILINKTMPVAKSLKKAYETGNMRFETQGCKNAFVLAMGIETARS